VAKYSPLQLHSPRQIWTTRIVVFVLAAVCGYLIFEFGRIQADYNVVDAVRERQTYVQRIAKLEREIVSLKEEVALLETHRDIDREAYRDVEASLTTLQAKVSPEDGRSGFRVQNLKLTRGKVEQSYDIRLVLVQSMQHDRKVSGEVSLSVEGVQDGVETNYSYSQLLPDDADGDWLFSFRYFQDFNRQIILPDGFTPERIKIEVRSKTRSIASIEESYSWAGTLG
jgi:cell division protein FtsB